LQTIRALTADDSKLLLQWSKSLPLEKRAYQIINEELLEKSLEKDEKSVNEMITKYHIGPSEERRNLLKHIFKRNRKHSEILQEKYEGRCQICAYDPVILYGVRGCYTHHIIYLSRGGVYDLDNLVLICPNHHEIIHSTNAVFDFYDLCYVYPNGRREPLVINNHLKGSLLSGRNYLR